MARVRLPKRPPTPSESDGTEETSESSELTLPVGAEAEVRTDDPGFAGSFYDVTVTGHPAPGHYTVVYSTLEADGGGPLQETAAAADVRPRPPREGTGRGFALLEAVEAFHNEGWWAGVVSVVPPPLQAVAAGAPRVYEVAFPTSRERMEFEEAALRPHRVFQAGRWVPAAEVSEVYRELKGSMGNASATLRALRRQSQDESGENVAVNLVVRSPAPAVANRSGVPTSHAGSHASPIDVEALDDGVQAVPASQVPPVRRSQRTRRAAVPGVDEQVHAPRRGSKRRRVAAVTDISEDTGEGSSLKVSPKEPIFTCPVCWDALDEPATTTCGHIFCTNCIKKAMQVQKKCPTCQKKLKMTNFHRIYLPDRAT